MDSIERMLRDMGILLGEVRDFIYVSTMSEYPRIKGLLTSDPLYISGVAIALCHHGYADVRVDDEEFRLSKGCLCIILPDTTVQVLDESADFDAYWGVCSPEFIQDLGRYNLFPFLFWQKTPYLHLPEDRYEDLYSLFRRTHKFCLERRSGPYFLPILRHTTAILLYELLDLYRKNLGHEGGEGGRKHEVFSRFHELVKEHCTIERSPKYYAEQLHISSRYLSMLCNDICGTSSSEYINQVLMTQIRHRLLSSRLSILQISEEMHFSTPSLFIRFFRKYEGTTPHLYRREKKQLPESISLNAY